MDVSIEFIKPSTALIPYIKYYLFTDVAAPEFSSSRINYQLVIVPDGEIELHIGYQDTSSEFGFFNEPTRQLRSAIVGVNSLHKAISITSLKKQHKCAIIKFKSLGFYKVFGLSLYHAYNRLTEAEEVIGARMNYLYDQIDHAKNNTIRAGFIERFLLQQLGSNLRKAKQCDERVSSAIEIITNCQGRISLPELLNCLDISERPLQRDFNEMFGVSPIQFCKIVRFQYLLNMLDLQVQTSGSDLVFLNGYFDQSHLIHDFKKATTMTPRSYQRHINKNIYRALNTIIFPNQEQLDHRLCKNIVKTAQNSYRKFQT